MFRAFAVQATSKAGGTWLPTFTCFGIHRDRLAGGRSTLLLLTTISANVKIIQVNTVIFLSVT